MKHYVSEDFFTDKMSGGEFSDEGIHALFEYLEELEDEVGEEIELEPDSIREGYSEYPSVIEAAEAHGWQYDGEVEECDEDEDYEKYDEAIEKSALEFLENRTVIIGFSGGVIIKEFV